VPDVYTHGHHESVLRSHRWRTAENSAGYLLPHLKPHMRILDVGCGPGTITADLADRVPRGHVTGIDTAPGIVEQAREQAGERDNLDFTTGDVYALDFPDDTFCVVHAHQVLQHLTDPVAALREMRRVCKPGGLIAARDGDYGAMTWYPQFPVLDAWLDLYHRVARGNGGEPDAGRRLHVWAREAGLADVAVSSSTWTFATPQERAWWGGLWADRTVKSSYAANAIGGRHATQADLDNIAEGWRAWAAHQDGWFAVVNGEILCRVS
jgi:SAM-dependent methyltransferase